MIFLLKPLFFALITFFVLNLNLSDVGATERTLPDFSLTEDSIEIGPAFDGYTLSVFGVKPKEMSVVMTVKGPEKIVKVEKAKQIFGVWLGKEVVEFRRVPHFYKFYITDDLQQNLSENLKKKSSLGLKNLGLYAENISDNDQIFENAMIAKLQQDDLYALGPKEISLINDNFFKADIHLPPGISTGIFDVNIFWVNAGEIAAHQKKTFKVKQVGLNAKIYGFAMQNGFLYGIIAMLISLMAGFASILIVKKK